MTSKIFLKLIGFLLGVLLLALIAVDQLASRVTNSSYVDFLRGDLAEKGRMLASTGQIDTILSDGEGLQKLAKSAGVRLTIVDQGGRVLADSTGNASKMENHLNRPEILEALAGRESFSIHKSQTLNTDFLYFALPYGHRALRLAVPLSRIQSGVDNIRRQLLYSTVAAFLPAFLLAAFLARNVSGRLGAIIEYADQLAKGNFSAGLARTGKDELGLLGSRLIETGRKLQGMVQALEKEHAELEKLERVRKDFVINVSHELRTPLASIQGYAETLLDGALEDTQHNARFVEIIRQNAQRLANLTADLLTLSRIELGQRKLHLASAKVQQMVEDAVDSMHPIAAKKNITLALDVNENNPEVFCDSEAVVQILTNLLDNAIKYTPVGGIVSLGLKENPTSVEISVRDSGIGIPQEELPRLFERFYRVDKVRSKELGGTGLGLAIVKHLVKAQGGDVWVTSVDGKGSEFTFSLPCSLHPYAR